MFLDLNLDDNEPGVEDLDDIAGGQLYRLRRGGSGLSNSGRGGHSASRGRGGASNRGAHVSAGGRGNSAARGRDVDSSKFGYVCASDAADNVKFSFQTNRLLVSLGSTIPNVVENLMPQLMQVLLAYSARLSLAGYLELKIVLSRCLHWRLGLLNLLFDLQLLQ